MPATAEFQTEKGRTSAARRARRALDALGITTEEAPLVGVAEAADYLGVAKSKIKVFLDTGRIPAPVATLTCGKVWLREELRPLRDELEAARARRNGDH